MAKVRVDEKDLLELGVADLKLLLKHFFKEKFAGSDRKKELQEKCVGCYHKMKGGE